VLLASGAGLSAANPGSPPTRECRKHANSQARTVLTFPAYGQAGQDDGTAYLIPSSSGVPVCGLTATPAPEA
jgi:hypothetical protein